MSEDALPDGRATAPHAGGRVLPRKVAYLLVVVTIWQPIGTILHVVVTILQLNMTILQAHAAILQVYQAIFAVRADILFALSQFPAARILKSLRETVTVQRFKSRINLLCESLPANIGDEG